MKAIRLTSAAAVLVSVLLSGPAGLCAAAEASPAEQARAILDAAGVAGGLIIHAGCGDGRLTAALGKSGRFLVRGLAAGAKAVASARRNVAAEGAYGRTSIGRWDGRTLPVGDNLANLIVWEGPAGASAEAEAMRVLAPCGVLLVRKDGRWDKRAKPRPDGIDEWTHFLHGPDNNAVARDKVVGPPTRLQWIADPIHLRTHEHLNSVSAVVSAGGRIFYVLDEGATAAVTAPSKWRLVARDAFNGLLLWKRDMGPWEGHFRLFRSGPPAIARRLVADGSRVYVTLGYGKPVTAIDAATGRTVRTYDATNGALEIIHDGGRLFVVTGEIDLKPPADPTRPFTATPPPRKKGLVAVDAASGRLLWKRADADTAALMPTTLAAADGRVFAQNTRQVLCLDAATGKEAWRADRPVCTARLSWSAPTLVASGGVVLSADGPSGGIKPPSARGGDDVQWIMSDQDIRRHPQGDLVAFDAATGKRLWDGKSLQGFCNPGDLFVIDGLVWAGADVSSGQVGLNAAVDLRTGAVKRQRPANGMPVGGHTRCYRNKATERFLVMGDIGVEFVDVTDWSWNANSWVRGTCQYGVMPCNGLLYVPPDSCACRPEMRLHGFTALAPAKPTGAHATMPTPAPTPALEKGPAYAALSGISNLRSELPNIKSRISDARSQISDLPPGAQGPQTTIRSPQPENPQSPIRNLPAGRQVRNPQSDDWPTYRGDVARTGRTAAAVPVRLGQAWEAALGGELTAVTAGAGKVFVCRVDRHTVFALDAASGKVAWQRIVGGPVDSPPTICGQSVIFGCRDGFVYCLRAGDGELVWRFRAGPQVRSLVAMETVESAWPVNGSVLVRDGLAWFVAGRSPYLDGGIRVWALDAASGKMVVSTRVDSRGPASFHKARPARDAAPTDRTPPMLPDILSASDGLVYMRWMGFDERGHVSKTVKPHLFSATGFLDGTWWHRTYWQFGTWMRGGFGGWPQAARAVPAGRMIVLGDDALFGFGRTQYDPGNPNNVHAGHIGVVKNTYQDEGWIDYSRNPYRLFCSPKVAGAAARRRAPVKHTWDVPVPMLVRGMVLADRTLFIAGPLAGKENRGLTELGVAGPGLLWAVAAADGRKLADLKLPAAPVLDGMAAAGGRLLVSCVDGSVRCLAAASN